MVALAVADGRAGGDGSMTWLKLASVSVLVLTLSSCDNGPTSPTGSMFVTIDFSGSTQGFVAGFADYPPANAAIYFLQSAHLPLPEGVRATGSGLFISGVNRSDDLFMYYKGRLTGLMPNTMYRAGFVLGLATNAPRGCTGVGGAPGESVYLKAGVSAVEPVGILAGDGHLRMNIDKGNQSNGGADAVTLGDVANTQPCGEGLPRYELKTVSSGGQEVVAQSDAQGRLWLLFGTDSGFESLTALWYTQVSVNLTPVS